MRRRDRPPLTPAPTPAPAVTAARRHGRDQVFAACDLDRDHGLPARRRDRPCAAAAAFSAAAATEASLLLPSRTGKPRVVVTLKVLR